MSWQYAHTVEWTCDACGGRIPGYEGFLPDGWSAERDEQTTHHYCPDCSPESEPVPPGAP